VEVVALLALDAVAAVGEVAVVEAVEEKTQDAIGVFLAEEMLVAWRLFVVLPHTIAGLAVGADVAAVVEVRNLDIAVPALAEAHLEVDLALAALALAALALEDLACAVEDHVVDAVADHYEDCR
jgi:hypothetical protein